MMAGAESWMRRRHCFIACCASMAAKRYSCTYRICACKPNGWCFTSAASMGAATFGDFSYGGAFWVSWLGIQCEDPMPDLYLLYLTTPFSSHGLDNLDFHVVWLDDDACALFPFLRHHFCRTASVILSVIGSLEWLLTMAGSFFSFLLLFLFSCVHFLMSRLIFNIMLIRSLDVIGNFFY